MINSSFEPARKETSGHFHVCGIRSIHTPDVNQSIERYALFELGLSQIFMIFLDKSNHFFIFENISLEKFSFGNEKYTPLT